MALKPLQAGKEPLGQFDGLDTEYLTLKGGEVGSFVRVAPSVGDKTAADQLDGYVSNLQDGRVAITKSLTSGMRPLMLLDEGTTGYGTMFGTAVGGVAGHVTSGLALGPHTAYGSGKVTCWDKPGLYAVTLDAVAADLAPTTSILPGAALYATAAGLLTSVSGNSFEATCVVARFVEFSTSGSYVTTQSNMASGAARTMTQVVIHFHPNN